MSSLAFFGFGRRRPVSRATTAKRSVPRFEALEDRNLPDATSYVNALYIDLLNRQPSAPEAQGWVRLLNSGVSTTQVALDFLNSPEYARDQIRADYEQILGREPEPGALAAWQPLFDSPGGPQTVEALFLASNEYFQRQGGTTADWLAGVYVQALNRGVDPGGLAAWTSFLQQGASRYTAANLLIHSGEGLSYIVTSDDWTYLRRPADSAGVKGWVTAMQVYGFTPTLVRAYFLGSAEYFQKSGSVQLQYGDVVTTGITPDTGISASDNITNNPKISVLGTGTPNTAFYVSIDGVKDVSGITDANGHLTIALSHPLTPGTHSLLAYAYAQHNTGMTIHATIDTTAPQATLTAPDFTETTTPTVSVSGRDNTAGTLTYYVDVDLKHDGSFTDPGDAGYATGSFGGGQTQTSLSALREGTYNLQVRLYDAAGNLATSAATMQVDPNAGFLGDHWLRDLYNYTVGNPNPGPGAKLDPNIFLYDSKGRVLVDVRSTLTKYMAVLQSELQALGMTILAQQPSQNMLIGWLPINQIMSLANQAHFSAATAVLKPEKWTGSVDTEGDSVIQADTFRANTGLDGTGVGVGILSDSVNEFGGGLAQSQSTGDLPPIVNVLEDDLAGGGTDEGRAMLEIVHDIAPGASLAFHSAFNGPQDFAQGILDLMNNAGAKVIADDVGYADEPMFNDGIIAQAVNLVNSLGDFYASAAGNASNQAWTGPWAPVSATVGGTSGTFETFPGWSGPGNAIQQFTLPANGEMVLSFQWDSAFLEGGSPLPNFQVPNDLAVLVTDATGATILQTFDTNNKNTDEAFEFVDFVNPNNATTTFGMAFEMNNPGSDPAPTALRWVNFNENLDPQAVGEGSATSFGHPVATGAVAVGAVPWFQPDTPEPFTAQGGPVTIFFDAAGNRLATPEVRNKPDVAGPDGVSTTFFGQPNPPTGQAFAFFGTSAATPHVAGAAALLLEEASSATPDQITQHLELTAIDVNPPGFDNLTGFGRIIVTPIQLVFPDDRLEFNDTSDAPTQFGTLAFGSTVITDLTIGNHANGLSDYDWYEWSAGGDGIATATINRKDGGDLELHLFTVDSNGTLVELGSSATPRARTQAVSAAFSAGQVILVEVKGRETSPGVWAQGSYDLTMDLQ